MKYSVFTMNHVSDFCEQNPKFIRCVLFILNLPCNARTRTWCVHFTAIASYKQAQNVNFYLDDQGKLVVFDQEDGSVVHEPRRQRQPCKEVFRMKFPSALSQVKESLLRDFLLAQCLSHQNVLSLSWTTVSGLLCVKEDPQFLSSQQKRKI